MLWAEKLSYTALILTSSANSMFSLILEQWWMSPQLNWSILVLLGIFFCPEILQYAVQCFLLSYAIWGFPNAKLIGSCLHTAGVKTFYTNVAGKKEIEVKPIILWLSVCLFLQISNGDFSSSCALEKQKFLCYIQTSYLFLIFCVEVFQLLGSDYMTSFQQKNVPLGLALFIWRLEKKPGKRVLFLPLAGYKWLNCIYTW